MRALIFAWSVCKHVKSNAIVYARDGQTVGVGAGQMSRVDSAKFGAMKAILPLQGTVAASDAFFPFPDGVEEDRARGATAVIQPGGSVATRKSLTPQTDWDWRWCLPAYGTSGTKKSVIGELIIGQSKHHRSTALIASVDRRRVQITRSPFTDSRSKCLTSKDFSGPLGLLPPIAQRLS